MPTEDLVRISSLPEFAQQAFPGTKTLNQPQSRVCLADVIENMKVRITSIPFQGGCGIM